ncbi:MAG: NAD(P)/FAD-dependent oxidoreductase [Bacteroidetes bacterium]|nr:NAD(P)/FAD-dependent oxidoreductase [Bacteroidota bacterium]
MTIAVIGGGAAGFFSAIQAANLHPQAEVVLLEKTKKLLSKVLVSGGGRCNVTHACFDTQLLASKYPRGEKELRSAFRQFSPTDTIQWFKQQGVTLKTEPDGRIFPTSNHSETIADCLLQTAHNLGVKVKTGVFVKELITHSNQTFTLKTETEYTLLCNKLIVAIGGNAKSEHYNWLRQIGHNIIEPVPSLFTFNIPNDAITKLMGLSMPKVKIKIAHTKLQNEGALLITHWGLSGPAVLKLSAWGARQLHDMNYKAEALINWLPDYNEQQIRETLLLKKDNEASKQIQNTNLFDIPKRLWAFFCAKASMSEQTRWAETTKKQINELVQVLQNDRYGIQGKTTFKEEFVTCGGVSLKEIDFNTMQSKKVPNLFFAGEVLDIDGITGGFNFQNAWTSAWIAAQNLVPHVKKI